nr:hypothetical protein [candidate division Zixibacteria bacterium]
MTLTLNHKVQVNSIIRNIGLSQANLSKIMEKLASGQRINSAADDPAGLVISEQMRSRIASLNQEIENTSLAVNKYQTASSTALQLRGILTELNSLTVAAANTAVNSEEMTAVYQGEANRLVESYNHIVETASFGNSKLLDGSEGSITAVAELGQLDLSDATSVEQTLATIESNVSRLDLQIADMGAAQKNDLESRLANLRIEAENLTAAESQIRDTDYTAEYSNFILGQMQLKASIALLAHSHISSQMVLSLIKSGD